MDFPLSKLSLEYGDHVKDAATGWCVCHVTSAHSLIQAAGYLKHTRAKTHRKGVFFRGQPKLYGNLAPTLLRGIKDPNTAPRIEKLNAFLQSFPKDAGALRAVHEKCREPLLQHYGIKTTWIDVVDNIWVALWFACHTALSVGRQDIYLHFEKRIPKISNGPSEKPSSGCLPTTYEEYAYILLLESAFFEPTNDLPGHYRDERSETIDLRIAAPSQFIRPHAQHGVLIRRLSNRGGPVSDSLALLVGIIRVDLAAALDWLGIASTLTVHSLFPPAFYDYGYRELLSDIHPTDRVLGSIHRIQA